MKCWKVVLSLQCVYELLGCNVETTWTLLRRCVVFCPRFVAAPVHSLKPLNQTTNADLLSALMLKHNFTWTQLQPKTILQVTREQKIDVKYVN